MATAVLVDADFFLRRYRILKGPTDDPTHVANDLHAMALDHVRNQHPRRVLYRIFVYDCPPLAKKAHHPVTGRAVNFAKTNLAAFRLAFHQELKKRRKVALRLGYLDEGHAHWTVRDPTLLRRLLSGSVSIGDLSEDEVTYYARQKGVDIRIGIDISSLTLKRQTDQIVLVSGDSDFVPAAKLARREGVDFLLDPMWANIRPDLNEHIDGIRSIWPKPIPGPSVPALADD